MSSIDIARIASRTVFTISRRIFTVSFISNILTMGGEVAKRGEKR